MTADCRISCSSCRHNTSPPVGPSHSCTPSLAHHAPHVLVGELAVACDDGLQWYKASEDLHEMLSTRSCGIAHHEDGGVRLSSMGLYPQISRVWLSIMLFKMAWLLTCSSVTPFSSTNGSRLCKNIWRFLPIATGWFIKLKWSPAEIHMPHPGSYLSIKPKGP